MKKIGEILRRKMMKSRKRRNKLMISKHRPVEVMQATQQQQQENYTMLLDMDMLVEILSRLPVKSLLRFMCVSKHWKTLISSDSFRKLHRIKHTSSPPVFIASYCSVDHIETWKKKIYSYLVTFDRDGKSVEKITLPFPRVVFAMKSLPHQSKLLGFIGDTKGFYFYNPSTRQTFMLTEPPFFSSPKYLVNYGLEYGYIPSKDEYILAYLVKSKDNKLYCEVLKNISISNDNFKLHYNDKQWRSIESPIMTRGVMYNGIYVAGAFYWLGIYEQSPHDLFILCCDIETDCISYFSCPEDLIECSASLLNLKDELYLANYPDSPPVLVLWKLSSDSKLWTPYWKFDMERLFGLPVGPLWDSRHFDMRIFLYQLKYLKGYDQQPRDDEISDKMGELYLGDGYNEMPFWVVEAHTNLFTL